MRDFDPTLNIRIRPIKNKLRIELPKYGDESFWTLEQPFQMWKTG